MNHSATAFQNVEFKVGKARPLCLVNPYKTHETYDRVKYDRVHLQQEQKMVRNQ